MDHKMSAREKLKKITRKLSRKLLGLPLNEQTIDSDTRRLVRETAAKALHINTPSSNPIIKHPSSTVTKNDDESGHINFHRKQPPTVSYNRLKAYKVEKIVYYSEDGKLLD